VQLHLDPDRKADPFSNLPRVKLLHGLPGAAPAKETVSLQWKNADLLEAAIPIAGRETVLNTVEISGQQPVTLPPVCLPYSPEFAPDQPGRGEAALAQIATTTNGREREEIPKIWEDLPVKSRYVELAPWLLVIAAVSFLLEIFERRTGWVSKIITRKSAVIAEAVDSVKQTEETNAPNKSGFPWFGRKPRQQAPAPASAQTPRTSPLASVSAQARPAPRSPVSTESTIDAMRKARERAQRRRDKEQ